MRSISLSGVVEMCFVNPLAGGGPWFPLRLFRSAASANDDLLGEFSPHPSATSAFEPRPPILVLCHSIIVENNSVSLDLFAIPVLSFGAIFEHTENKQCVSQLSEKEFGTCSRRERFLSRPDKYRCSPVAIPSPNDELLPEWWWSLHGRAQTNTHTHTPELNEKDSWCPFEWCFRFKCVKLEF